VDGQGIGRRLLPIEETEEKHKKSGQSVTMLF
jgi:hypothetical protein